MQYDLTQYTVQRGARRVKIAARTDAQARFAKELYDKHRAKRPEKPRA